MNSFVSIEKVAVSTEKNCIKTKTVCIGEGLSATFSEALAALPPSEQVSYMIGDLNGEPYRADEDEFAFSVVRTAKAFADPGAMLTPTSYWGDIGAASPLLFIALAIEAQKRGYVLGPPLIWASSEGGTRGASLLRCPSQVVHPRE